MRYIKAEDVLPFEILELVQQYIDGELLYIPKCKTRHNAWGSLSGAKEFLLKRNELIYSDYQNGFSIKSLSENIVLLKKVFKESSETANPPT